MSDKLTPEELKNVIEQVRDYSPRTSPDILKAFLEGSIHLDFLRELAIRIEQMRDVIEVADSKTFLKDQGGIQALRLVSGIFTDLYENSVSDTERDNQNKED